MPTQNKSTCVGPALDETAALTTAYRAIIELECVQCKGAITPDQLFSRPAQRATRGIMSTLKKLPVCFTCRPLRLQVQG